MKCFARWIIGALVVGSSFVARADEATLKQAVTALFDQGWKPTSNPALLEEIAGRYAAVRQAAPGDLRGPFAYALVLMRQRKYDDALKQLDEVLLKDKENLAARRMKIWLLMFTKKYSVALVELDAMSKLLPAAVQPGEADEPFARGAEFIGRMYAFVEGPVGTAINNGLVLQHKTSLFGRLSSARQDSFEAGYKAVTGRYKELIDDKDQTQSTAKADEDKQKEETKKELEIERARTDQELTTLNSKSDKVRAEGSKEIAQFDAQLRPLNAELARTASRRNALAADVIQYQNDITSYLDAASRSKDANEQFAYRSEANRLDIVLGRANADLRAVELQLAGVEARRAQVEGQRQAAAARQQQQLDGLERQIQSLQQAEKRISLTQQKLSKPATGLTAKVVSQTATVTALTTYDEFPLEFEKQRVLDSLK